MVSLVTVMTLTDSFNFNDTNTDVPLMVPSMVPWLQRRHHLGQRHGDAGGAEPLIFSRSSAVPLMRSFLPSKSESRSSGRLAA